MREQGSPNWTFIESFRVPAELRSALKPEIPSWSSACALGTAARAVATAENQEFLDRLSQWNRLLNDLGGDPSTRSWTSFRPLRLSREEDWSDWLAHLIESSRTGQFAASLLSPTAHADDFAAPPIVVREERIEARRADIVVVWKTGSASQIEVKVGDEAFEKTFDTAMRLRGVRKATSWTDYILLPESSLARWEEVAERRTQADDPKTAIRVHAVTWRQAAVSLRRALAASQEDQLWRALAYTFCGAIEQRLLGLPIVVTGGRMSLPELAGIARRAAILKESQP